MTHKIDDIVAALVDMEGRSGAECETVLREKFPDASRTEIGIGFALATAELRKRDGLPPEEYTKAQLVDFILLCCMLDDDIEQCFTYIRKCFPVTDDEIAEGYMAAKSEIDRRRTYNISMKQVESFAQQIAEPDFDMSQVEPLIGHLNGPAFEAVMTRAEEIAREEAEKADAAADALEELRRLALASGCPKGTPYIPWLQERGLIEEVEDGWTFRKAGPGLLIRPDEPQ
jgi:hypothetical protein